MERVRKNGTRAKAARAGRRLKRGSGREGGRTGGKESLKQFDKEIIKPRL